MLDKIVRCAEHNPGVWLCKSKSEIRVEYALEIVNKPMGAGTYWPKDIALSLPNEEQFKRIFEDKMNNLCIDNMGGGHAKE